MSKDKDNDTWGTTIVLQTILSRQTNKSCHVKGLVTKITHVQYESSIASGKKVTAKVKVFVHVHKRTRMRPPGL